MTNIVGGVISSTGTFIEGALGSAAVAGATIGGIILGGVILWRVFKRFAGGR